LTQWCLLLQLITIFSFPFLTPSAFDKKYQRNFPSILINGYVTLTGRICLDREKQIFYPPSSKTLDK